MCCCSDSTNTFEKHLFHTTTHPQTCRYELDISARKEKAAFDHYLLALSRAHKLWSVRRSLVPPTWRRIDKRVVPHRHRSSLRLLRL
jgi:hypothetical protein